MVCPPSQANTFLAQIESSPVIDNNSKALYTRFHEVWKSMNQFISQTSGKSDLNEILSSVLITGYVKRRFKQFHEWLNEESKHCFKKLDFPNELTVTISAVFMDTLQKLNETLTDQTFEKVLRPSEERLKQICIVCADQFSSYKTIRAYAEYLSLRWVLNLDQCTYPIFNVNMEHAYHAEMLDIDSDTRQLLTPMRPDLKALQMRYSRSFNWMINDYLIGLVRRMHNIYSDAAGEVSTIHDWRLTQQREKRKLESECEDQKKTVAKLLTEREQAAQEIDSLIGEKRKVERENEELKNKVVKLLTACEKTTQEIDSLRKQALKQMDANALNADDIVRSHFEMSQRVYSQNQEQQALIEKLLQEKKTRESSGSFLGLFK